MDTRVFIEFVSFKAVRGLMYLELLSIPSKSRPTIRLYDNLS
jgi:hypothetical protein